MQSGNRHHMTDAAEFQTGIRFIIKSGGVSKQQRSGKGLRILRKGALQALADSPSEHRWRIQPGNITSFGQRCFAFLVGQQKDAFPPVIGFFPGTVRCRNPKAETAADPVPGFQQRPVLQIHPGPVGLPLQRDHAVCGAAVACLIAVIRYTKIRLGDLFIHVNRLLKGQTIEQRKPHQSHREA